MGIELKHRLNWSAHCVRIRGKAIGALRTIGPLFRSSLPRRVEVLLFKSDILPIMTYDTPAWAFISKSNMKYLPKLKFYDGKIIYMPKCKYSSVTLDRRLKLDAKMCPCFD